MENGSHLPSFQDFPQDAWLKEEKGLNEEECVGPLVESVLAVETGHRNYIFL